MSETGRSGNSSITHFKITKNIFYPTSKAETRTATLKYIHEFNAKPDCQENERK